MRIVDAASFGSALRKQRKRLGYTQAQVAAFSGCSAVFLSALENGKPTAELGRALRVANTLGINITANQRNGDAL